jgi:hypothetical protein
VTLSVIPGRYELHCKIHAEFAPLLEKDPDMLCR